MCISEKEHVYVYAYMYVYVYAYMYAYAYVYAYVCVYVRYRRLVGTHTGHERLPLTHDAEHGGDCRRLGAYKDKGLVQCHVALRRS